MSAASASAYSWTESEELITVGNADEIWGDVEDVQTAILNESVDEVVEKLNDQDLVTAASRSEDLVTARSGDYSEYTPPLSETFVDMDDVEPNSVKTAEMDVSLYTPPPSVSDVDMERDVVGEASPMSTAITGSISWYSMPPSETDVEVPSRRHKGEGKITETIEYFKYDEQIAHSEAQPGFAECQDETVENSDMNQAFLENEDSEKESGKDSYDFDTAIET
ncbi:unnamed protein product [Heligmosomoides polygyrus]|uniref:Uncharacterized protein n=1 Tax=Heligmosomoides polygyrus TaxID=6339 RepID=A0A3P7WJQ5_HELPZ|nr:unnamed protein product [Heligmosomoides polygyrus]